MSDSEPDVERYDILIVGQNRTYSLSERGLKGLINYLIVSNVFRPEDEAIAKEWVEVYGKPGPTAHEAFMKGAFDSDLAPYFELTVRNGKQLVTMPYGGGADEGLHFYIDIRGCLWNELGPRFKNRLTQILMARVDIITRPHAGVAEHREVPEGEVPDEVRFARKDRAGVSVGTKVEEF